MIKPGSVDKLANATIEILKDNDLAAKMSHNAREKAVREFSKEKMIDDTLAVFAKLIEERK